MLRVLAAAALLGFFSGAAAAFEPSVNYMLQCMGCHTPDGSGEPGRVPSIRQTLLPLSLIPEGREFLVRVPGSAQSTLSDAELAELLNWMIGNLGARTRPAAKWAPFTGREVARYRRAPLVDVQNTRERLLSSPVVRKWMAVIP